MESYAQPHSPQESYSPASTISNTNTSSSNNNNSNNMSSKLCDSTKPSKRKGMYDHDTNMSRHVGSISQSTQPSNKQHQTGTRSVSTLTPSQLARKRANDREAQRAIRARTKEHIENLERELEELRSYQSRDKAVQDLLRKNKALEDELYRLRDSMGMPNTAASNGMYQSCTSTTTAAIFYTITLY